MHAVSANIAIRIPHAEDDFFLPAFEGAGSIGNVGILDFPSYLVWFCYSVLGASLKIVIW